MTRSRPSCSTPWNAGPRAPTHWSSRLIAKRHGLSHTSVQRIWHAFGLKPHRTKTFKLSTDPDFVGKVRDIVGLYLDPPTRAVVLCVDEKSQIQALDRSQPVVPLQPATSSGAPTTTSAMARRPCSPRSTSPRAGDRQCQPRHRASEFLTFLDTIEANVPTDLDVHLVMDNYATPTPRPRCEWLARRPALAGASHTPTSASWLNQIERFFALLTEREIRRGVYRSVEDLEQAINAFLKAHNADPKPFRWTKSAEQIIASFERFCLRTAQLADT